MRLAVVGEGTAQVERAGLMRRAGAIYQQLLRRFDRPEGQVSASLPDGGNEARLRSVEIVLLAIWLVGAAVALALKNDQLFVGFDGGYMRDLARRQFEWNVPIFSTSIDLFQGIGDVFFSGINFTLLPSYIVGNWFGIGRAAKVINYLVILTELTVAVIMFARALNLNRAQALAAALLVCLLMFPIYRTGAIYSILALVPHFATFIAASLFISIAFLRFGRGPVRCDVLRAITIVGLGLWSVHVCIIAFVLSGPSLLIAAVCGIIAAKDWAERRTKFILIAVTAAIFAAPAVYLLGLLLNTAPIVAPTELVNNRTSIQFASILFHWSFYGPVGPVFICAAILGAILSVRDRSRPTLRIFAITLLTYLTSRLTFWLVTVVFDFWRGPSALYFEFFVYPLYAIFSVVLVWRVVGLLQVFVSWRPSQATLQSGIVFAAVVLAVSFAALTPSPNYGFPFPPAPTGLTPLLEEQVGLKPPAQFRGRVITLTGRGTENPVGWIDLHMVDGHGVGPVFGNEMRLVGLHFFGIPGFFQYGSTMTPAFYAVMSRLLADPRDKQQRSVAVVRRYEARLFAMLGIRYAVTDAPVPGETPAKAVEVNQKHLMAFEIPNANIGNYSPTRVAPSTDAARILRRMAQTDFNPAQEIIGDVPGGDRDLREAKDVRLDFDGVALTVTAASAGRSILLLPLEFSRCLVVTSRSGDAVAFRANLLLTGLVFSGPLDATIALRTGPFINPACRLYDLSDLLALGIRDVPKDVSGP